MKNWRIVQSIFEGDETEPTLTHVFYGETPKDAAAIYWAHMGTDEFMRACVTKRAFRDFKCAPRSHFEFKVGGRWLPPQRAQAFELEELLLSAPQR